MLTRQVGGNLKPRATVPTSDPHPHMINEACLRHPIDRRCMEGSQNKYKGIKERFLRQYSVKLRVVSIVLRYCCINALV